MMEEQNNIRSEKDVELLSQEVQEVMQRIPSFIIRWGMSIIAIIISGMLIDSGYIRWPKTIECTFEGLQMERVVILTVTLPDEIVQYLLHHPQERDVNLFSPMFSEMYSSTGVLGTIVDISVLKNLNNEYLTELNVKVPDAVTFHNTNDVFYGKMLLIVSEKTLLQLMLENIKI